LGHALYMKAIHGDRGGCKRRMLLGQRPRKASVRPWFLTPSL
jgi:hypothetical protein